MIRYMLASFALLTAALSFGQTSSKKNDIYLEAGGNGLFGSLNYERRLATQPGFGVRIGIGFYSENAFYLTVPVGINYLFKLRSNKSFIDAGLGASWARADGKIFSDKGSDSKHFVNFIPSLAYRRYTRNDIMLRIGLTPIINNYGFVPWLGASIGKRF